MDRHRGSHSGDCRDSSESERLHNPLCGATRPICKAPAAAHVTRLNILVSWQGRRVRWG